GIIIGGTTGRYPPVVVGGGGGVGTTREEYQRAGDYLRELAAKSGGRHYQGADLRYIEEAFTNIAEELRRQYSLGYYPSKQSASSERRQIKVRVKRPNLVVRARDSYIYKPSGSSTTAQDNATKQTPPPELRKQQLTAAGGRLNQ
ncbi:MAG: hypothetical protein LC754_07895, partial [Acidobacteria bacterium]|nr:hypothetical protein [Acidobacteriota bacterium]